MTAAERQRQIEVFSPTIGEEEKAAVAAVLDSGWLGAGPKVAEFEQAWARHVGVPVENVVAVSCATEGLFQVMALVREMPGNKDVLMPGNVYIGAVNANQTEGGPLPLLCDIDPHSLNPTFETIADYFDMEALRQARSVVLQHFGGVPTDLDALAPHLYSRDVVLIEDCACAPASTVNGQAAGTFGDFGIWSFDAMKVMTCGDGGMVYCRDVGDAESIRRATRLGLDNLTGQGSGQAERWWEFKVQTPGRRAMMNDIGAALGLVQLEKLPQLVRRRKAVWQSYQAQLSGLPWLTLPPEPPPGVRSSYYCYWVQCERRDELARHLRERGIYTTYRYHSPALAYGWTVETLPGVEYAQARTLLLPLHANLSGEDVDYICESVRDFGRLHA